MLPLTRAAGLQAGELLARLRGQGTGIDIRDAMQAGICRAAEMTLVTKNRSHFDQVPDLEISSPEELLRSG